MSHLTVGDAAREIAAEFRKPVRPKWLTNLLYDGALRADLAPLVSGRRMIAREALPYLISALKRTGKL